jgi:hypothetical protein
VSKLVQEFEIMAAFFKIEYPTLLNTMQATAENEEIDRNTDSKVAGRGTEGRSRVDLEMNLIAYLHIVES